MHPTKGIAFAVLLTFFLLLVVGCQETGSLTSKEPSPQEPITRELPKIGGGRNIVGKWALADQDQLCSPIRVFQKIEFRNDGSVIYYEVIAGEERSADIIIADYSLSEGNRLAIHIRSTLEAGATDWLDYELFGNTLQLCDDSDCCDLVRE